MKFTPAEAARLVTLAENVKKNVDGSRDHLLWLACNLADLILAKRLAPAIGPVPFSAECRCGHARSLHPEWSNWPGRPCVASPGGVYCECPGFDDGVAT